MEGTEAIMVTKPVYDQFQTILECTHMTSSSLMEHFLSLYNSTLKRISTQDIHTKPLPKGDNYSKVVVTIPKNILRRDISVNVSVQESCMTSDSEDSSDDNLSSDALITGFEEKGEELTESPFSEKKSFCRSNILINDITSKDKQQTFQCKFCTFKTKGIKKFKYHMRKHSENKLICCHCAKTFEDKNQLLHHIKNNHGMLTIDRDCVTKETLTKESCTQNIENNSKEKTEKCVRSDKISENIVSYQTEMETDDVKHVDHIGDTLNLGEKRDDNSSHAVPGINSSHSLMQVEHDNSMNNLVDSTRISNVRTDTMDIQVKNKFLCGFCGKQFVKFHLFCIHRDNCRINRSHFICHCKMKFKWKSLFLHHKKKCNSCRVFLLSKIKSLQTPVRRKCIRNQVNGSNCINNELADLYNPISTVTYTNNDKNTVLSSSQYKCRHKSAEDDISFLSTRDSFNNATCMQQNCLSLEETQVFNDHINEIREENSEIPKSVTPSSEKLALKLSTGTSFQADCLEGREIIQTTNDSMAIQAYKSILNFERNSQNELVRFQNIEHQPTVMVCQNSNNITQNYNHDIITEEKTETDLKHISSQNRLETSNSATSVDLSLVKKEPMQETQNRKHDTSSKSLQNNQTYSDIQNLRSHNAEGSDLFSNFIDDGEVHLKCEECGELFKRKAYLKEHIEGKHSGDLRYSCDCGKKFKWRSSLGNHRKHCYQALLFLSQEGHVQGQSISVIDFSQCGIPNVNMQHEWEKKIESMNPSIYSSKDSLLAKLDLRNRQRHMTSPEKVQTAIPQGHIQRRKSDGTSNDQDTSLRINSTLVKPIADALNKYQQKQQADSIRRAEETTSRIEKTLSKSLDTAASVKSSWRNDLNCSNNGLIDLTSDENHANLINRNCQTLKSNSITTVGQKHVLSQKYQMEVQAKVSEVLKSVQANNICQQSSCYNQPEDITVECNLCKEKFSNTEALERHKIFCRHLQDTCSVCGKTFQHRSQLVNHLLSYHGNDETYTCFCGLRSADWKYFEKHCEKCEEFKNQSKSFLLPDKNKKSSSDTKHTNTSVIDLAQLTPIPETNSTANHQFLYEHQRQSQLLRTNTIQTEIQQSTTNFQNKAQAEHLDMKSSSNEDMRSRNLSQNLDIMHQNQGKLTITSNANTLPTISSFVTQSSESLKTHDFSYPRLPINQIQNKSRENVNLSKFNRKDINKKDVFVCTFCGNVYNSLEKFSEHNKIHRGDSIVLPKSGKQQKSAVEVAMDRARQLPVRMAEHVCHLCGDVFAAKAYLKEHISGKHGTVDRYTCPCGMRFKWRSSLGIHQRKCSKSNKRTYNRWNSS